MNRILIIQHYQNDFVSSRGSLYVPNAEKIVDFINVEILKYDLVIPVYDWHPKSHISFKEWPIHCVQNARGSRLYQSLLISNAKNVLPWYTGYNPKIDCYSAFRDNGGYSTYLHKRLYQMFASDNIEIYIVGVVTDVCVEATALDSILIHGLPTYVFRYGIAGLDKSDEAIERMIESGVIIL